MMKKVLLGFCLLAVFSFTKASDKDLVSLKLVLDRIELEHNLEFNYDETLISSKQVALETEYNIKDIEKYLNGLLSPLNLKALKMSDDTYVITNSSGDRADLGSNSMLLASISPKPSKLARKHIGILQDKIKVTGTVVDESGTGIPGVNILIEGTQEGTITNVEGLFSINVESNAVLKFSFVGYKTVVFPVDGKTSINITLVEDFTTMEEVVVIGYGTAKKSDLTGSLSSIKARDLSATPITSMDQGLQGRAAGVQVTQVSGRPGGETSIRIRGTSSINAGNEPLYIIDGMMVMSNSGATSSGGSRGPKLNPLSTINPNDIESIEVLKDASALAIYGSRGSNGVVLITTKKGKAGAATFTLDSYYGLQQVQKTLGLLNGEEFARFINEVRADQGVPLDPNYLVPENYGEGTNWQGAIFRDAPIQSYQLNFSGGTEKSLYNISGGYFNQQGIIVGSDFERVSFRSNVSSKFNEKVELGSNVGISYVKSNGVLTNNGTLLPGVSMSALLFPPTQPVFDSSVRGGYTFEDNRGRGLVNPYADAIEVQDNSANLRALGSIFLTYSLTENLQYKLNFGFDAFSNKENRFVANFLKRTLNNNGEAVISTVNGLSWLMENTLSYSKQIAERHSIDAVAGFTAQQFSSENLFALSLDFDDNRLGFNAIQNGNRPQVPFSGYNEWGILSYLGRVNYILDDKYLFTISGRVDGSSRFGKNNKYGFFPSAAIGWRLSDEPFFNSTLINFAKMRLSYGVLGNQDFASYQSISTVGLVGEGSFGNNETFKGQGPLNLANPNLVWEKANQFDAGFDLELLEGKVNASFDYYLRFTSDLLLFDQVTFTTGFGNQWRNVGSVRNQGIELTLNSTNIDDQIRWTTQFNTSYNVNEITKLTTGNQDIPIAGAFGLPSGWSILRKGEAIGSFYGLLTDGIFQSESEIQSSPLLTNQAQDNSVKPGDRKYKDINGRDSEGNLTGQPDGVIDEADRVIIGNSNPKFIWGMTNRIEYGQFDFSIFIQGAHGHKVVNANMLELGVLNAQTNVLRENYVNRWTEDNPSNEFPRLNPDRNDKGVFSDAYVEDASYVRIQNITLGYNLSGDLLNKLGMRNARVYLSGTNLMTFTNYSGYDPEASAGGQSFGTLLRGIDYGGYPTARTVLIGAQITF